jgi:hypothetical protein
MVRVLVFLIQMPHVPVDVERVLQCKKDKEGA